MSATRTRPSSSMVASGTGARGVATGSGVLRQRLRRGQRHPGRRPPPPRRRRSASPRTPRRSPASPARASASPAPSASASGFNSLCFMFHRAPSAAAGLACVFPILGRFPPGYSFARENARQSHAMIIIARSHRPCGEKSGHFRQFCTNFVIISIQSLYTGRLASCAEGGYNVAWFVPIMPRREAAP